MIIARTGAFGLAVLLFTAAAPAIAQSDIRARAQAYIDSAYPADGPGAAVIITDDGKVVYEGGRGLADVAAKTPITPDTVFRLGSITKQFSAAVILQLAAEGKLSLSDPLSKYLPSFPKPGADATIAQLLNHTSGVQSYTGIPGWMSEANITRPYTTEQMVAVFKDLPSPSKPGEKWSYNNSGYVLVGAVIEAVTGKPWYQAVEERIARPLGLKTIRYGVGEEQIPKMAKGYSRGANGVELARGIHMSVPHAAGALVGSVEDLAKWADALHHGKLVNAEYYARMTSPTTLPDGTTTPYGFALGMLKVRERDAIGHGGGIPGFSTDSVYIPGEDIFVAVFTNSDGPATRPEIAAQVLAALALGDPFPVFQKTQVDPASLAPLFGVYKMPQGERRFYARDGKLYTKRSDAAESEVFAAGNDRFFYGPRTLNWFEVRRDPAGAHVMEMHQGGAKEAEKSVRAGPIPPEPEAVEVPRATLDLYAGDYKAPIGAVVIALNAGGALTIQLEGQPAFTLTALSTTEFEARDVGAKVVFHLDAGKVSRLVIHQGGRELPAERVGKGS